MIDHERAKQILNEGGRNYTDSEVRGISELLLHFALLTVETFKDLETNKDELH